MREHRVRVCAVTVATLPNGEQCVVSGDLAGCVRAWNAQTGEAISVAMYAHSLRINGMAAYTLPSGQHRIAAASNDGSISVLAWRRSA